MAGTLTSVEVAQCWCLQCEHVADVSVASHSGATRASSLRDSHDLRELERLVFETAAVHGQWLMHKKINGEQEWDQLRALDWSSNRVPVLALRQFLLDDHKLLEDMGYWRLPKTKGAFNTNSNGTPSWLQHVRRQVVALRADNELLQHVLAPFSTTLLYVVRNNRTTVAHYLDARHEQLAANYQIHVPEAVMRQPATHTVARAALLRVAVAYDLIDAFTGHGWDFHYKDTSVPYATNKTLQQLAYDAQLFADTHLDLMVMCELSACRYDDTFMASSLADCGDEAARYSHSNAAPPALTMTMLERYYPHPVRAPCGGELGDLGSPLYATDACSGTSSSSRGILDAVLRFVFRKTLNYRAMRRSHVDMGTRHMRDHPAIKQFELNALQLAQLGNLCVGDRMRPRWRARMAIRRSFAFDQLHFHPDWCPNCGTGTKKYVKVEIKGNQCPWCKPVERQPWCSNECMENSYSVIPDEHSVDALGRGNIDTLRTRVNRNMRGMTRGQGQKATMAASDQLKKEDKLVTKAVFRTLQRELHNCPHCEKDQQRRFERGGEAATLSGNNLLRMHYQNEHKCDYCCLREHDDAKEVRQRAAAASQSKKRRKTTTKKKKTVAQGDDDGQKEEFESELDALENAKNEEEFFVYLEESGSGTGCKKICSTHVCAPCRLLRENDRYCFHAVKEAMVYMIEQNGVLEDVYTECNMWEPYKRILVEGMDEIRSLIDVHFTLDKNGISSNVYVAFRGRVEDLWSEVRKHIHLVHRCSQPTVTTMRKGTFVKLLNEALSTHRSKVFLNKALTRPQRPVDYLRDPKLMHESPDVIDDDLRQLAEDQLQAWKDKGYLVSDVRRCAEIVAEMAINDSQEERACGIFFRLLRHVGMSDRGLSVVQRASYEHAVCRMPDHRLEKDYVSQLARQHPADFFIVSYFCEEFLRREPIRIFPLSAEAARAQMQALRRRNGFLPFEEAPVDIDMCMVCIGCGRWYAHIVSPIQSTKDITNIISNGNGNGIHGCKAILSIGPSDLKRNLRTGELMCSRDHKSSSSKKMRSYGMFDVDIDFSAMGEQLAASKASSIRKKRERRGECSTVPLKKISMLGVMARVNGSFYALCGICGSRFQMVEGKPMFDGIPNCGRHVTFGDPHAYEFLRAYRPPFNDPVRSGKWLRFAQYDNMDEDECDDELGHTARREGVLSAFDTEHIMSCVSDLQYEYASPPHSKRQRMRYKQLAQQGWVKCTPIVMYPKGIVEATAVITIQRIDPTFSTGKGSGSDPIPSATPAQDDDELVMALAHYTMFFDTAERRMRREQIAAARTFEESVEYVGKESMKEGSTPLGRQTPELQQQPSTHQRAGARSDSLERLPERVVEMRHELNNEFALRGGATENVLVIMCAFCGSMCDKLGKFVRIELLDIDHLARDRYTRIHAFDEERESPLVECFLCENHFMKLVPLLRHYSTPTTAMMSVFLHFSKDSALDVAKYKIGTRTDFSSVSDTLLRDLQVAGVHNGSATDRLLTASTRRSRMPAIPTDNNSLLSGVIKGRRGRPRGKGRGGKRGKSGRKAGATKKQQQQ